MKRAKRVAGGLVAALSASLSCACSDWLGVTDPAGHLSDASTTDGKGTPTGDAGAESGDGTVDTGDGSLDGGTDAIDGPSHDDAGCPSSMTGWSPGSLSGLVVWLDADRGIGLPAGSLVPTWLDQSPVHNDAAQSDSTAQPRLEASAIGGFPGLRFDGSSGGNQIFMSIPDNASLQWGTQDYTVEVVARFSIDMGTTNQMLYLKSQLTMPYVGPKLYVNTGVPNMTAEVSYEAVTTSTRHDLNDAPHVFGARRAGTSLEVRVDGTSAGQSTQTLIDLSVPGQDVIIGANGYKPGPGLEALEGYIAEIVAVKGTVSDPDIAALECYLTLKYGL